MFPLGTVLFPHAYLPLHVFEPRYRTLTRDCLAGRGEFGVVLIERGSEVGGGDVRTDLGTVARIVEAAELPDGRWVLATVGTRRLRVLDWLPDDPYPQADVELLRDDDTPSAPARLEEVERLLRRVLALRAELGDVAAPATLTLDTDRDIAAYQVCTLAGLGPVDSQRLLAEPTTGARVDLLGRLLGDEVEVLELRLRG
jgi:Lon protease-like protein